MVVANDEWVKAAAVRIKKNSPTDDAGSAVDNDGGGSDSDDDEGNKQSQ